MSNRLSEPGRLPLIPEPLVAARAGAIFSQSRLQSIRVFELGKAFLELPSDLWNLVRQFGKTIENAMRLRDVACMNDHLLADIGIRRDQLPGLFLDGKLADIADNARGHRKSSPAD